MVNDMELQQRKDESTQTLRTTQSLYDRYQSLLQTSSHLIKQIEKADWYDRLIIFAALLFFLLVCGFIVKRRVLDKVVGGVGWWVGGSYKLLTGQGVWRSVKGKGSTLGLGKGPGSMKRFQGPVQELPHPSLAEYAKSVKERIDARAMGKPWPPIELITYTTTTTATDTIANTVTNTIANKNGMTGSKISAVMTEVTKVVVESVLETAGSVIAGAVVGSRDEL